MKTKKELKRFKAKAADDCSFTATIATLGVVDADGDLVAPGALDGQTVPIQPAHDQSHHALGKARVEERGGEAVAVGEFNSTQAGRDWCSAVKFDIDNPPAIQEWSWGYVPVEWRMDEVDGKQVRVLERVDLLEVSPVIRGASVGTGTRCAGDGCKSGDCDCGGERRTARVLAEARRQAGVSDAKVDTEKVFQDWLARQNRRGGIYGWRRQPARVALALKVAEGARALGIAPPPVYLVERCPLKDADVRSEHKDANGWFDPNVPGGAIYVAEGLGCQAELEVVGHELAHSFQHAMGLEFDEKDAQAYGPAFERAVTYGTPMPTIVGEPAA